MSTALEAAMASRDLGVLSSRRGWIVRKTRLRLKVLAYGKVWLDVAWRLSWWPFMVAGLAGKKKGSAAADSGAITFGRSE